MGNFAARLNTRVRWGLAKAEAHAWERFFSVDTRREAIEWPKDAPAESIAYEPLPWILVRRAVKTLALQPDDVFVDYGSGLGRVMLMAARERVRRVLGVELFEPLAAVARKNLAAASPRLRSAVEVVVGDARRWPVPDDLSVAFLFNPFVGSVMDEVQGQLRASLERRPRRLRVLYAHAFDQPDLFARCPWLQKARTVDVGVFGAGMHVALYETA